MVGYGSDYHLEPGVPNVDSNVDVLKSGHRRGRNLTPPGVRNVSDASALSGRNAPQGAESLWQMFLNLVYGDPTCPDAAFSD